MFFARIYDTLKGSILAEFSKLKTLQGAAFHQYRDFFNAKLIKSFIVPAFTFDNVRGNFPIGFKIWDTGIKEAFKQTKSDIYDADGIYQGTKKLYAIKKLDFINKWISRFKVNDNYIGFLAGTNGNDFQQNKI